MSMKFAIDLPASNVYGGVWDGQSNATPNGTQSNGFAEEPHLFPKTAGADVTVSGAGSGDDVILTTSETLTTSWNGAELHIGRPDSPKRGYARVKQTGLNQLVVDWQTSSPGTLTNEPAYLTFADGRHRSYAPVKVLTPFLPNEGGANPSTTPPTTIGEFTPAATSYEDLGIFLPFTFFEGVNGWGISSPLGSLSNFAVNADANSIDLRAGTASARLVEGAWLMVDSIDGSGNTTRRSFARITDSTDVTFTTGAGDITPGTDQFAEVGHGLVTGQEVYVSSSGAFPTTDPALAADTIYYAIRVDDDNFKIAATYAEAVANDPIDLQAADGDTLTWRVQTDVTVDAWVGGTPDGTRHEFMLWRPHYLDNPHAHRVGPGFLYPSAETQPIGAVYCRPRGNTTYRWGTRWGAMLPWASRMAASIGQDFYVVALAVDASSILPTFSLYGLEDQGWVSPGTPFDWHPGTPNGLAARMKKLVQVVAPGAISAAGLNPLKILGVSSLRMEAETVTEAGREQASSLLSVYYDWLKETIHSEGMSYYADDDRMPIVMARIPSFPWEQANDPEGKVNAAIYGFTAKTWFATSYDTNDSPQRAGDEIHFNAVGESRNGQLAAEGLLLMIEKALSSTLVPDNSAVLDICNLALSYIGQRAQLLSLDTSVDQSIEARHCARFFPQAVTELLQRNAWSFATKRTELTPIPDARDDEWACAYGVPENAVRVFSVLPDESGADYSASVYQTSRGVIRNRQGLLATSADAVSYTPQPFTVETDAGGHRVIYTNVSDAVGRYNVLTFDAKIYSAQFKSAAAYSLAAKLAGVFIKDEGGAAASTRMMALMERVLGQAMTQDAVQHNVKPQQVSPWMAARRGSGGGR